MNSSSEETKQNKKFSSVFYLRCYRSSHCCINRCILPEQFGKITGDISSWITEKLGWYYLILTTVIVFFLYLLIFSPIGKLKLGKPNDKPEFNTVSWFAMLFSAGMGIGLVFYGAAEPMADLPHHLMPILKLLKHTEALRSTFFHWGFHGLYMV